MESNVYTKNKIIEILDGRAYYIDAFTLGAFFEKNDIKPAFTDEQGNDFYDSTIVDFVIRKLFKKEDDAPKGDILEGFRPKIQTSEADIQIEPIQEIQPIENMEEKTESEPLYVPKGPGHTEIPDFIKPIEEEPKTTETPTEIQLEEVSQEAPQEQTLQENTQQENYIPENQEDISEEQSGIIEETKETEENMESENLEQVEQVQTQDVSEQDTLANIDALPSFSDISEEDEGDGELADLSILSDKSKQQNESNFQVDVSERTLNLIARAMAKKIAKHVGMICAQDAKASTALIELKEEYAKLVQKSAQLEEQNKKLRLLLTESNKNLNSYVPSIFGLYKKINPNKK